MTRSIAQNELRSFWDAVAGGGMPTRQEILDEGIPERFVANVKKTAKFVVELHDAGSFGASREVAREAATELREALGEDWEPPSERREPLPTDPRELAALVARRERGF